MAGMRLAMVALALSLAPWGRAASLGGRWGCLGGSECCQAGGLEGDPAPAPEPQPCPPSPRRLPRWGERAACQGQTHGPLHSRAVAPWRYWEDCDSTRFPRLLLQAECLCPHCVSLGPPRRRDPRGNSVPVRANTTVHYRRPCPGRPGAFYLEPHSYPLAVACVCVAPRA